MFIKNLNKREKYLAVATLSVAMIAAAYILVIGPISDSWKSLNNRIQPKVNMLGKDSAILANQAAYVSEYAKFSKYAKSAKSEEQAMSDTLAYVENVSRNDSCLLVNMKPVGVRGEENYKELLIDVTAEGSIAQLSKFLYDVENPRENLINIKRFTLSSKSSQSSVLKGTFLISKALLD